MCMHFCTICTEWFLSNNRRLHKFSPCEMQCNLNPPLAIATVSPIRSKVPKCINDTLAIPVIPDSLREKDQFQIQDWPEVLSDPTAVKMIILFEFSFTPAWMQPSVICVRFAGCQKSGARHDASSGSAAAGISCAPSLRGFIESTYQPARHHPLEHGCSLLCSGISCHMYGIKSHTRCLMPPPNAKSLVNT